MGELETEIKYLVEEVDAFVARAEKTIADSKASAGGSSGGGSGGNSGSGGGGSSTPGKAVETVKAQLANFDPKTIAKSAIIGLTAYALYDVATSGSSPEAKK